MGALTHIPGLWLDVTRTLTRIGRGAATGIDRVEREYITAFLDAGCDRFICRTTRGYLVLDGAGARLLSALADGSQPLGRADVVSTLTFRGNRPRHKAEAALRGLAIDRCRPGALPALLGRHLDPGRSYFNVGHSNLSTATLEAFANASARVVAMVHDLIPITHPVLVADDQPANFAGRIERLRTNATHIIANSQATADALADHWRGTDHRPDVFVSRLGVEAPDTEMRAKDPLHFVMLGTIEPRKNHSLMVDVWEALAQELPPEAMPSLHIIGATGWKVDTLMARLAGHPLLGRSIFHHGPLPDAAVRDHLSRARALLFPSIVEGYGFPPLEAALHGAVPICSDLPVFRETLGDCAVYVNNPTAYQWKETIEQLISGKVNTPKLEALSLPTWQEHFEIVAETVASPQAGGRP